MTNTAALYPYDFSSARWHEWYEICIYVSHLCIRVCLLSMSNTSNNNCTLWDCMWCICRPVAVKLAEAKNARICTATLSYIYCTMAHSLLPFDMNRFMRKSLCPISATVLPDTEWYCCHRATKLLAKLSDRSRPPVWSQMPVASRFT
jgi:hypothetical protein